MDVSALLSVIRCIRFFEICKEIGERYTAEGKFEGSGNVFGAWMWARAGRGRWWWTATGGSWRPRRWNTRRLRARRWAWAEQDPEDWWRGGAGGDWRSAGAGGARWRAVGLTGQMHGCVMLDAEGEVLRPALIWCDQRTQAAVRLADGEGGTRAAD